MDLEVFIQDQHGGIDMIQKEVQEFIGFFEILHFGGHGSGPFR